MKRSPMASDSFPMSASQEPFQCSLCFNMFSDPVSTPCGHTFCQACLCGYWDNSELCQCPRCNKRFHSRPEISTNVVLEELCVQVKRRKIDGSQNEAAPWDVACDFCPERKLKAFKSCLVCLASFCESHLEPHLRVATLKGHELVEPAKNLEDKMCKTHARPLEMFCRREQMCVCAMCFQTDHRTHEIVPLETECEDKKAKMKKVDVQLKLMIQCRLKKVEEIKRKLDLSKANTQAEIRTSREIWSELTRHIEKSQGKLAAVMQERQKAAEVWAKELIAELEQEVAEIQSSNAQLEQLSHTEDHIRFLQSFRSLFIPLRTRDWADVIFYTDLCVGTLRRSLSKLSLNIRAKIKALTETELKQMRQFKENITLDEKTANSWLYLSEFGKRVKSAKTEQKVTDNPERFDLSPVVLAEQAFGSGCHYWEVQVSVRHNWVIGVAEDTVKRKGSVTFTPKHGFYVLSMYYRDYFAQTVPAVELQLRPRPRRVAVYLDHERGQVSFFDIDEKSHIYTFAGQRFAGKLRPCFYIYTKAKKSEALIILSMSEPQRPTFGFMLPPSSAPKVITHSVSGRPQA